MSKFCYVCMEQYDDALDTCPFCGSPAYTTPVYETHLVPGYTLYDRYIIGRALGAGGFGITYISWDTLLHQKVAIKEYLPPNFATRNHGHTNVSVFTGENFSRFNNGLHRFINEARRLARNNNVDGIVRVLDCFEENDTAYIVMEFIDGATLEELLKENGKFEPDEALRIIMPLIRAIDEVHKNGIFHRDIAPDNIILTKKGKAVLIDFGSAKSEISPLGGHSSTVIVKPGYSPEEQYSSQAEYGSYTDVYALAGTLYKMITGETPPDAPSRRQELVNKRKDPLKPISAYGIKLNPKIEQAIAHAMVLEANKRTHTMLDFYRELNPSTSAPPPARSRKIPLIIAAVVAVLGGASAGILLWGNGINHVQIKNMPAKTEYYIKERFDETGLDLEVTNRFGVTKSVTEGFECFSPTFMSAGEKTVEVMYKGYTIPITVNVKAKDYSELKVIQQPQRTEFFVNEPLDFSGIKLEAHYGDSSSYETLENPNSFTISPASFDRPGLYDVTIAYENVSTTYQIKIIQPEIETIVVSQPPNKTDYLIGDPLDHSGLTLTVTYSDGSTQMVTEGFTLSETKLNKPGNTTITVNYEGKEASFDVAVQELSLQEIRIDSLPSKLLYTVAEELDITGMKVVAVMSNGAEEILSDDAFNYAPKKLSSAGTKTITVTYSGKKTSFEVTVEEAAVTGFSISAKPSKLNYNQGDSLNTSGMKLKVRYNNGDVKEVTSGFTCSPTVLNRAGTQTITVTYGSFQQTFTVNVKAQAVQPKTLKNLKVATNPKKVSYTVGDTLDLTGLTLTATYSDGSAVTIKANQVSCSTKTLSKAGTQTITVSYGGLSTSFSVKVEQKNDPKPVTLSSISVKTKPRTLNYFVGDSLDQTGLTISAKYSDGKTKTVTSGFSCDPLVLKTPGTQRITVSYEGKTTSFEVKVEAITVSSITVLSKPAKTKYVVGNKFDPTGLSLEVTYSNGNKSTITEGFTYKPTVAFSRAGEQEITITYEGKTTSFPVTVIENELISLSIKTEAKTLYQLGDAFNTSGLVLNGHYADGSIESISSGFTTSFDGTTLEQIGTFPVTVSYKGLETKYDISVSAGTIREVSIAQSPNRTKYSMGEQLDLSGLVLLVTYENGRTEMVSSGYTTNTGYLMKNGIQTVDIYYNGYTVSLSIVVGFSG